MARAVNWIFEFVSSEKLKNEIKENERINESIRSAIKERKNADEIFSAIVGKKNENGNPS